MALQSLILPIVSLFRSAGITQARNAIFGLNKDLKGLAGSVGKAAGSFAAFQAVTGSRQFLLEAVENTQQFERNMLALGQVFEGLTPQMDRFTQSVRDYGIGQNQAAQASVFIGSVLKQYGFGVDEAADATQRIVKLAQDLATTYGYDVSEALLATTALFRGEFDPIEKFGVAMKQNEINAELLARGLGDLTGAQRENAEAQITLDFLFERAADSVGAFTRATDTLYAAQKRLEAGILNLQIALGEPLQGPLADVTNAFAELIDDYGPEIEELGRTIAEGLDDAVPAITAFGKLLFELTGPLQFFLGIVERIGGAFSKFFATPLIEAASGLLDSIGDVLKSIVITADNGQASVENFFKKFGLTDEQIDDLTILDDFFAMVDRDLEHSGQALKNYNYENDQTAKAIREATYELTRFQLQADRSASALIDIRKAAEQQEIEDFQKAMRGLSVDARDAEGNLIGVAKIFADIDEAAAKSNAKQELEALNVEAGLIEAVLEEPNWQEIFGQIARYARLAAIDISKLSYAAAVGVSESMRLIAEGLPDLFGEVGAGGKAEDAIADFYDGIEDAIAQESARRRLRRMGASEGLIEAILGSGDWEKVFNDVIKRGIDGLQDLQAEFDKTAEGIREVAEEAKQLADEQAKALADAIAMVTDFIKELQAEADRLETEFKRARAAADNFLERLEDFSTVSILPDFEREIGQFETAVVGSIDKIRSELKSAFRSDLILQSDFDALMQWVTTEEELLRRIANQRDDLANRYALSEALINDYRKALTGAFNLTSLFGRLKTETEKRTVTEVSKGIVELENGLKEFAVTVTRSYEETVDVTQDKTKGLLDGFREMADKARKFAENLQKLRALGLDPMLFNQLVEAGVEAGGETAQALVDGGSDTINEINSLFQEIDGIGKDLGEQVAATMYGAGVDMSQGLLEGIASEREALMELARELGKSFTEEFESKVSIAIEKPVTQAEKAFEAAQEAVPDIKDINLQAITDISKIIQNAEIALTKQISSAFREGITEKKFGAMALLEDLKRGIATDIGGITSGMTSADFRAAALGTGGQIVNNYYVELNASSRAAGAKAGEAFREALDKFETVNGNF